jgi:hypothetical protein
VAEGKAAPECFELELGGFGGGLSQPFGERIHHAGPACLGGSCGAGLSRRGERLQQSQLGWRIQRCTTKLIENGSMEICLRVY